MQPQRPSRSNAEAQASAVASGDSPSKRIGLDELRALIEPVALAHGVELVDVEWTSNRAGRVLRITIDRPENATSSEPSDSAAPLKPGAPEGVTLDDCVRVSRDVSTALDVHDPVAQRYSLEVSSPGLDRPLTSERDFRRQVGRLAKVKLHKPAPDGQTVLRGTILGAADGSAEMEVDGNHHRFALANVREAKLVFELGSGSSREGQDSKRGGKRRSGARKTGH
jgi:ribosome maturation factor RimP